MDKVLHRRALVVSFFLVAGFSLFSAKLYYIQVVRHPDLAETAAKERSRKVTLPGSRGSIFDRRGEVLVQNQPVENVIADRVHLTDRNICLRGLAHAEGLTGRELKEKYRLEELQRRYVALVSRVLARVIGEDGYRLQERFAENRLMRIPLRKGLEHDEAEALREELGKEKLGGIYFEDAMKRFYPNPRALSHALGFVDSENAGKEGLERAMEKTLAGADGHRYVEIGGDRREIAAYRGEEVAAKDGNDVHLTIDMGLQTMLETALDNAVLEYRPERVMGIFMNPMTGEILAMGSRPDFNLRTRTGERKNLVVSHNLEPGSMFKIVALGAAFDRGLVQPDTLVFCHNGHFSQGHVTLRDHSSYGDLAAYEVLKKSSNIGAYLIAKQVGAHGMYNYIRDFGFGTRTGIRLSYENAGAVIKPNSRSWSATTLSRVAMGYSVDVSPLQMANAMCVIANGGSLMKPYIVRKITDPYGRVLEENQPEILRTVISEKAANMVRKAMISVTEEGGTAIKAAIEGFLVAGKTGTAKKPKPLRKDGYYQSRYVVSFMGFLPAENPRLAGLIIVDDPQSDGSRYGGTVAAPIWKEVAEKAMPYLGVEPSIVPRRALRAAPRTVSVGHGVRR